MDKYAVLDSLNSKIYGHLQAKKSLINLFHRSELRYLQKYRDLLDDDQLVDNLNVLLVGDTGTGKTYLVETLAKLLDRPFIKFDASSFNPVSNREGLNVKSVSNKIHNYIKLLYEDDKRKSVPKYKSVDGLMHQTIVYIDEFDKMCLSYGSEGGGWRDKTQGEFLTLFENKGEFQGLSFIFSGAFVGLQESYQKPSNGIGFFADKAVDDNNLGTLTAKLTKFGVLPEVLGRIGSVVLLDDLTIDCYLKILEETLLPKFYNSLSVLGVNDFSIETNDQYDIAMKAKLSGLGVRGLKASLNGLLTDLEFDSQQSFGYNP